MHSYLLGRFLSTTNHKHRNHQWTQDPGGGSLHLPRKQENVFLTLYQLHDGIDDFIKRFDFSDVSLGLGF